MKRFFASFIFILGLAAAAPTYAQTDPEIVRAMAGLDVEGPALRSFLARSSAQGLSRDFVLGVLQEAKSLESRGIPSGPYLLKANEGLAKGVPPEKIRPALKQTQDRSENAARLVDSAVARGARVDSPMARRQAILQFQSAMLNGVSAADLEKQVNRWEKSDGTKPSLEQIGTETRALQPRRHVLVPSMAFPKAKPQPQPWETAPKAKGRPNFETEEQGPKNGGPPAWKAKGGQDRPEVNGSEGRSQGGKGPWKSKENSGSRGQEKGKKK